MERTFKDFKLSDNLVEALHKQNITTPTQIQLDVIEKAMENLDIVGEAHTGSGKTLAFLLPMFTKIDTSKKEMQGIILAPTHELVVQINDQIKLLAENSGINMTSLTIMGDANIEKQIKRLKEKPHIIVGSPGRILDLIKKKKISAHTVKTIVLDEADNLLDKTKSSICLDIIKTTMRDRQLMFFSATITNEKMKVIQDLIKESHVVKVSEKELINPNITHISVIGEERDKFENLRKAIASMNPNKAIVFINNAYDQKLIVEKLNHHKKSTFGLHGKLSKEQRQNALESFKKGKINILVSSDVSARGLDIQDVTHIFHLDFPKNAYEYLHRAGRTARAFNSGISVCIGSNKDLKDISRYERELKIRFENKIIKDGKLFNKRRDFK